MCTKIFFLWDDCELWFIFSVFNEKIEIGRGQMTCPGMIVKKLLWWGSRDTKKGRKGRKPKFSTVWLWKWGVKVDETGHWVTRLWDWGEVKTGKVRSLLLYDPTSDASSLTRKPESAQFCQLFTCEDSDWCAGLKWSQVDITEGCLACNYVWNRMGVRFP